MRSTYVVFRVHGLGVEQLFGILPQKITKNASVSGTVVVGIMTRIAAREKDQDTIARGRNESSSTSIPPPASEIRSIHEHENGFCPTSIFTIVATVAKMVGVGSATRSPHHTHGVCSVEVATKVFTLSSALILMRFKVSCAYGFHVTCASAFP